MFWFHGPPVACADIEEIGCRIVSHGVPRSAASAPLVPFAGPRLGRHFELGVFEGFCGVARNGIKAPRAFSGFGVVGGEVASDSLFRATRSNNNLAFDHADSGSENRVASGDSVLRGPDELPRFLVESHHTAVKQSGIDAPLVNSDSPVDRSAAETGDVLARDIRIPAPFGFARTRVHGKHYVPGQNTVEDSVVHERRGFHGSLRSFSGGGPRQREPLHVLRVDLIQRAEVRLRIVMAIREPLGAVAPRVEQLVRCHDTSGFLRGC